MGLECIDLTVRRKTGYGQGRNVLDHLDARFPDGCLSLVAGPTGAGKSTLLNILGALMRPTAGEMLADGQPVSRWKTAHRDRWRRHVGMVFQQLHLMTDLCAEDNVRAPLIPRGMTERTMRRLIAGILDRLDLTEAAQTRVRELSGGQRQRVAIARAMVGRPKFLLLDEATTFQDDDNARDLIDLWRQYAVQGACVVLCSHDQRVRRSAAFDQAGLLRDGRLEITA